MTKREQIKELAGKLINKTDDVEVFDENLLSALQRHLERRKYKLVLTDVWNGQVTAFVRTFPEHEEDQKKASWLLSLNY